MEIGAEAEAAELTMRKEPGAEFEPIPQPTGSGIVCIPHIELWEMTAQAVADALEMPQVRQVLVLNNGQEHRALGGGLDSDPRVLRWHHSPPLPTLNMSWNAMLDYAWAAGFDRALVVNNDVRLLRRTWELLSGVMDEAQALFVTAVGVRPDAQQEAELEDFADQFFACADQLTVEGLLAAPHGGPDYSCFMISRTCHLRFRFDPQFTYFGDNDHHYRMKRGGEDARIFGVQLPFWHFGSGTLKNASEAEKHRIRLIFEVHRQRYLEKWGGVGGQEVWTVPGGVDRVPSGGAAT